MKVEKGGDQTGSPLNLSKTMPSLNMDSQPCSQSAYSTRTPKLQALTSFPNVGNQLSALFPSDWANRLARNTEAGGPLQFGQIDPMLLGHLGQQVNLDRAHNNAMNQLSQVNQPNQSNQGVQESPSSINSINFINSLSSINSMNSLNSQNSSSGASLMETFKTLLALCGQLQLPQRECGSASGSPIPALLPPALCTNYSFNNSFFGNKPSPSASARDFNFVHINSGIFILLLENQSTSFMTHYNGKLVIKSNHLRFYIRN